MALSKTLPSTIEYNLRSQGFIHIAGVDEVGRGCLAGPVVAAAVMLPSIYHIEGLNDSKKLTPKKRDALFIEINKKATAIGIGIINQSYIDKNNILQATFAAMKKALNKLPFAPNYILVDGSQPIPNIQIQQKTIIGGDGKSASIAAASIIAKVTRDKIMGRINDIFPEYDFKTNKGYGTKTHQEAIFIHGACILHRRSFNLTSQLRLF